MDNKTCECTVGIWHNYEDSHLVTYSELKELSKGIKTYSMKDYLDARKSNNKTIAKHLNILHIFFQYVG